MIQNFHDEQKSVLCIPESCVEHIVDLYHNSLLGAHQSSLRTFLTIKQKFVILNLMHFIKFFLKGCQTCQLHKVEPTI